MMPPAPHGTRRGAAGRGRGHGGLCWLGRQGRGPSPGTCTGRQAPVWLLGAMSSWLQTARAARLGWSRHLCRHTHTRTHTCTHTHMCTCLVLPTRDRQRSRSPSPPSQPQQGGSLHPAPASPNQLDPAAAQACTSPAGPRPRWQRCGRDGAAELRLGWQGRPVLPGRGLAGRPRGQFQPPPPTPVQAQAVFTPGADSWQLRQRPVH